MDNNLYFRSTVKAFSAIPHPNDGPISEENAFLAFIVLNFYRYSNTADIFLAVASMNLLNAFVKETNEISYSFRTHFERILLAILQQKIPFVGIWFDKSKVNSTLMISVCDFQFSFHGEHETETIKSLLQKSPMEWDGIRKQGIATSIFLFAMNSSSLSGKTVGGVSFKDFISGERKSISDGGYAFINKKPVMLKAVPHVSDGYNSDEINYFRSRLGECKDKNVILIGKYKKAWDKHLTFISIKPYSKGGNARRICDHINVYRPTVEALVGLENLVVGHVYLLIGKCECYETNRFRYGLTLAPDLGIPPILPMDKMFMLSPEVFSKCITFSAERFLSTRQTNFLL